jgi:hypothetical protein
VLLLSELSGGRDATLAPKRNRLSRAAETVSITHNRQGSTGAPPYTGRQMDNGLAADRFPRDGTSKAARETAPRLAPKGLAPQFCCGAILSLKLEQLAALEIAVMPTIAELKAEARALVVVLVVVGAIAGKDPRLQPLAPMPARVLIAWVNVDAELRGLRRCGKAEYTGRNHAGGNGADEGFQHGFISMGYPSSDHKTVEVH